MPRRRVLPLIAVAALGLAPATAWASGPSDDDDLTPLEQVVNDCAADDDCLPDLPVATAPSARDDAIDDDADDADADDDVAADEAPTVVFVVVTLRDGTVAGSGTHEWGDDEDDAPLEFELNRAGRKAAAKGRVKLRRKATVRYGDGTTEVLRDSVWVGKRPAAAKKKRARR